VLTDRACRTAQPREKDWKLSDSQGLYLLVKPSGYKSWRLKYRFGGKEKQLTFGPYPLIGLATAREMRDAAKRQLLAGVDPSKKAADARAQRLGVLPDVETFKKAALSWHAQGKKRWKPRHAASVLRRLENDAFPVIGHLPIDAITPADVRPIIDAVQGRGAIGQAHELLGRMSRIFKLAIARGEASSDPAAALEALLQPVAWKNYPAILRLPELRKALKAFEAEPHQPSVKLASRLLALTAARPGTVRFAQAAEFHELDGAEAHWIIPAAKMKLERAQSEQERFDFVVPLSTQAVAVVKAAIGEAGDAPWLFPGVRWEDRPISDATLSSAYRQSPLLAGRHVPHGWRSSFSTIMAQRGADLGQAEDADLADLMLAHKPQGVKAIYNRAAYMPQRRRIAQEWADLLSKGLVEPEELREGRRR
jgi:integrase